MTGRRQTLSKWNRGIRTTSVPCLNRQLPAHSRTSWIALERLLLSHCLIALALFVTNATAVHAQRHGRCDANVNYMTTPRNPQLLLQIRNEKRRLYFRVSDLRKKPRSVITVTDNVTGLPHTYEGVSLDRLLPNGILNPQSGSLEVFPKHQHKVTIQCGAVDFQLTPLVADMVDEKNSRGTLPITLL